MLRQPLPILPFHSVSHCPVAASVDMLLQQPPGHFPYLLFLVPLYFMQRQRPCLFAPHPRDQLFKGLLCLSRFLLNVRRNRSCATSSHGHPPSLWLHMTLALLCEPYLGVCSTTLLSQVTEITLESARPKVTTPKAIASGEARQNAGRASLSWLCRV